jgi:hypothetical protein
MKLGLGGEQNGVLPSYRISLCWLVQLCRLYFQPYRFLNRGFNYYKYRLLSIVNRTSVFSKIIFLIQHSVHSIDFYYYHPLNKPNNVF